VGLSPQSSDSQTPGWLALACDAVVSLLFPADCRLCDTLLNTASRVPVCKNCLASFVAPPEPCCSLCGQSILPVGAEVSQLCPTCQNGGFAFDRAMNFAAYDGAAVRALLLLKSKPILPLAKWFADRLVEKVRRSEADFGDAIVVPVPLHRRRQRERGYNQADLIARPLARRLNLTYRPILLARTRPRPDKHLLTVDERWESVRGAFATQKGTRVDNLRVLLVDDVMTTGATLDACARVLREAGATEVIGLTVARAVRYSVPGSLI
jgi:ComF family protein